MFGSPPSYYFQNNFQDFFIENSMKGLWSKKNLFISNGKLDKYRKIEYLLRMNGCMTVKNKKTIILLVPKNPAKIQKHDEH